MSTALTYRSGQQSGSGNNFNAPAPAILYHGEDHLGSSHIRMDTNGTLIDKEEHYPFGDSSLRTWTKKRYRYTGKEKDAESSLYYYGARYYAAWTCRFISTDPLAGEKPSLNAYHYTSNNPINKIDPDGMEDVLPSEGDSNQNGKVNQAESDLTYSSSKFHGDGVFNSETSTHTVIEGNTLWNIAERYGVTVESLIDVNNLESDLIVPGQDLIIPPNIRLMTIEELEQSGILNNEELVDVFVYTDENSITDNFNAQDFNYLYFEGYNQSNVDLANSVIGGFSTMFGSSFYMGDMTRTAGRFGYVGYFATYTSYAHALASDQVEASHHVDAAITTTLLFLTLFPPTTKIGIAGSLTYGGYRLIGGGAGDKFINNQFK